MILFNNFLISSWLKVHRILSTYREAKRFGALNIFFRWIYLQLTTTHTMEDIYQKSIQQFLREKVKVWNGKKYLFEQQWTHERIYSKLSKRLWLFTSFFSYDILRILFKLSQIRAEKYLKLVSLINSQFQINHKWDLQFAPNQLAIHIHHEMCHQSHCKLSL